MAKCCSVILTDIPWDDVLFVKIFSYLNLKDIFNLRCVSKKYKELAEAYLCTCRNLNLHVYKHFSRRAFQVLCACCKSVRQLNLSKCQWLTDELLETFLLNNAHIVDFNVNYCQNITSKALQPLILNCKKLRTFKASNCAWLSPGALDALIYHQKDLEVVDLSRCTSIAELTLLKFVVKFTKLRNLSVAHIPSVTDSTVLMIANHCTNLEYLNLDGCSISIGAISRYFPPY